MPRISPLKPIILILFFLFSVLAFSQSIVYTNSATGNDTNDGSSSAPFKTFHKAYTSVTSGGTIFLTGTFTWTDAAETGEISNSIISGYRILKNLTIQGTDPASDIIQAATSSNTADSRVFYIYSGYTVRLNNVTVQNGRYLNAYSHGTGGGGIYSDGNLYLNNCIIKNNIADHCCPIKKKPKRWLL